MFQIVISSPFRNRLHSCGAREISYARGAINISSLRNCGGSSSAECGGFFLKRKSNRFFCRRLRP